MKLSRELEVKVSSRVLLALKVSAPYHAKSGGQSGELLGINLSEEQPLLHIELLQHRIGQVDEQHGGGGGAGLTAAGRRRRRTVRGGGRLGKFNEF